MSNLIATTLVLPLFLSAVLFIVKFNNRFHSPMALMASLAMLLNSGFILSEVLQSGIYVLQIGGWKAPFGISMVADPLSALMGLAVSLLGLCTVIYSFVEVDNQRMKNGYFPALFSLLAASNGVLFAGDIFNMYVWTEVMVISSFLLMAVGKDVRQVQASFTYVIINFFASILILSGVGVLFGLSGTLNLADLHLKISEGLFADKLPTAAVFFLTGFGIKAALFPLFFWLPDSYTRPSVAVSALLAGLYTKVAVCVLIRLFALLFGDLTWITSTLLWGSVLTMLIGVLGAVAQYEFRRLLSFHIVSQVGYMTLGLSLMTQAGISAALFFVIHNVLAKSSLFFISGLTYEVRRSFQLKKIGGFVKWSPTLALLFLISAYSLGGLPPLTGFWGKLAVTRAAFLSGHFFAGSMCLVVGFLTLYSMTKIWIEVFWKPAPFASESQPKISRRRLTGYLLPISILSVVTLFVGLFPDTLMIVATQAAGSLLQPEKYVEAVLAGGHR